MQSAANKIYSRYSSELLIIILVIFYSVGIVGMLIPSTRESILPLSAMNLALSFFVLIVARKTQKHLFLAFMFICFITGMTVEWIGIHTGWLFGDYAYDENLGFKFSGVPLIIGVNWGILSVVCCTAIVYFPKVNSVVKSLISAALMMILDILIEPVAVDSGYWHWNSEQIPIFNYICWFAIAFPLHFVYFRWKLDEQNKVSIALLIIMVIFFTVLNFR